MHKLYLFYPLCEPGRPGGVFPKSFWIIQHIHLVKSQEQVFVMGLQNLDGDWAVASVYNIQVDQSEQPVQQGSYGSKLSVGAGGNISCTSLSRG